MLEALTGHHHLGTRIRKGKSSGTAAHRDDAMLSDHLHCGGRQVDPTCR
jgi:hypothetical protein